jgi:hypothetical protein
VSTRREHDLEEEEEEGGGGGGGGSSSSSSSATSVLSLEIQYCHVLINTTSI